MNPDETIAQQTDRVIGSIDALQRENAQLRADLARERERSNIAEGCLASVRKFQSEEKARADTLEKELAELKDRVGQLACDMQRVSHNAAVAVESAESRLAAMQAELKIETSRANTTWTEMKRLREHADALAKAAEALTYYTEKGHPGAPCERTGWINSEVMDEYRAALAAYRAFTAEREKEKKP